MYISKEAVFRKEPKLKSEIIDILNVNDEVEVLDTKFFEDENESFSKVKLLKDTNGKNNIIEGFIVTSSLSNKKTEISNLDNVIHLSNDNKIKIMNEAFRILNTNTSYSAKRDYKFYKNGKTRANGYYNIPYFENGKEFYSYDCSAFCDTILNRVFSLDMRRDKNLSLEIKEGLLKENIWVTKDYFENALLPKEDENKIFDIIQIAENEGEEVSSSCLEIGDFIIGLIDFHNEKHNVKYQMNHIMLYIGDGYIAHASYTNGEKIFNKVLLTKLVDNFYTKVSFQTRFDKAVMVGRLKQ